MSKLSKLVSNRAKEIIERRGLSWADLASKIGGSRQGAVEIVTKPGTLKSVEKLAKALEVNPWDLLKPLAEGQQPDLSNDEMLKQIREIFKSVRPAPTISTALADLRALGVPEDVVEAVRMGYESTNRPSEPGKKKPA